MKKIAKILFKILRAAVFVVLIGFIIVVCLQRFSDNKISFFDYRMFTVISGSMRPVYDIGDVLISQEKDPEDIELGDVVSYLGAAGDFNGKVITHQVTGIANNVAGEYIFTTKGTANLVDDPPVHESQIYGVVVYKSFMLSFIYRIVSTTIGFYIFIIVPLVFIIGTEIVSTLVEKEGQRRKQAIEPKEDKKE